MPPLTASLGTKLCSVVRDDDDDEEEEDIEGVESVYEDSFFAMELSTEKWNSLLETKL